MGMYDITGWSGGGRRPVSYNLKAGQFRGMGKSHIYQNRTTIVNNNYFNKGCNFDNYDYGCKQDSTPKWMNWMMGIGLGTTVLGGILKLFGGKEQEGAGEIQQEQQQVQETETETQQQVEKEVETPKPTKKAAPKTEPEPEPSPYKDIQDGKMMTCRDASGKTQNITGEISGVVTDSNGVPQSFTLTDIGSGNTYEYKVNIGSNGEVTYDCVSKNEKNTIGAPNYTLIDGELVQSEGQAGFGSGIKTE